MNAWRGDGPPEFFCMPEAGLQRHRPALRGGGGGVAPEIVGISCDQISGDNWLAERERAATFYRKERKSAEVVVTKIPLHERNKSN
jgi:hypothetical protein